MPKNEVLKSECI